MSRKNLFFVVLLILSLLANVFLLARLNFNLTGESISEFRYIKSIKEEFRNSDIEKSDYILHYQGLRETLEQKISEYNATDKIGLFLQDAETGSWLGINEREKFMPASLLKIPIMMALLKKVERAEIRLDDKITLLPEDIDREFIGLYKREAGSQLSISELLKEMITLSDNTAKNALARQLSPDEVVAVFVHVGISHPFSGERIYTISPRNYVRILKSLYYSTYLTPGLSERALDLTTDTLEEHLLSKDIPHEIQVAHKFGMFEDMKILHDCGIVYHPKNPYYICIMTRDLESEKAAELIQKLSKEAFEFIDKKT